MPTLVARYQHAWTHAALDALRTTAEAALRPDQASSAAHRPRRRPPRPGPRRRHRPRRQPHRRHHRRHRLRHPHRRPVHRPRPRQPDPGLPHHPRHPPAEPADRPLPWLPAPNTGHPAWNDYLRRRAQLITDRAERTGPPPRVLPRAVPAHPPTTRRPRPRARPRRPATDRLPRRPPVPRVRRSPRHQGPAVAPDTPLISHSRAATERPYQLNGSANAQPMIEPMGHSCLLVHTSRAPRPTGYVFDFRVNGVRRA